MSVASDDWYSEWKGWAKEDFGNPTTDERAYCHAELGPYISRTRMRVLELGFGNGGLLAWCRDNGHDCVGIESNAMLLTRASGAGFEVADSLAEALHRYGSHSFDLAVALDVFEHIPTLELPGVLGNLHVLLKPGAVLIARFPNGDSPFGRASQHGDDTHVAVLGSAKLALFARRAGFTVACFKEPSVPLKGASFLRICKRLSSKASRFVIGALISHGYFAGSIRVFSANLVAVLRSQRTIDPGSPKSPGGPDLDATKEKTPHTEEHK